MGSGVAAVNAYLPLYLVERAGASLELAGVVVATIGLVGIFSRLAVGLGQRTDADLQPAPADAGRGAVVAIGLILAIQEVGLWVAWPAAVLFGATAVTWNAVGNLAVITESGSGLAGRASGVLTFGFYHRFRGQPGRCSGCSSTRRAATRWPGRWSASGFAATVLVILGWRRTAAHTQASRRPGLPEVPPVSPARPPAGCRSAWPPAPRTRCSLGSRTRGGRRPAPRTGCR